MCDRKSVKLTYFAILADQAGITEEIYSTLAETYAQLYQELQGKYGFTLSKDSVRVVANGEFIDINKAICAGDHIVFIPPVSGG